jgi:hypothetical protein
MCEEFRERTLTTDKDCEERVSRKSVKMHTEYEYCHSLCVKLYSCLKEFMEIQSCRITWWNFHSA